MAYLLLMLLMPWINTADDSMDQYVKLTPKKDYMLEVRLSNPFNSTIQVFEHSLPWKGSNSIMLRALKTDAQGTVLEKALPIDDPGPEVVAIRPGASLKGSIDLKQRFSGLAKANADGDVVIVWAYRLRPIDGPVADRVSGSFVLPAIRKRR